MKLEAVVGEADVRRKDGLGRVVVEIVAHMSEEGASWLEHFDKADGFFEMRVTGVGSTTERVEDEDVEVLEQGDALVGQVA